MSDSVQRPQALEILISAPSLDIAVNVSGISSVIHELSVALQGRVAYELVKLGAPQTGTWLNRRFASVAYIARAAMKLLFSRARVFHSNTAFEVNSILRDYPLLLIAKAGGKRVLLHVHGGFYVSEPARGFIQKVIGGLLRLADSVVFLSDGELKLFERRYPRHAHKMCAIYNSIDLTGVDRILAGRHEGDQLEVAFVGRLVKSKGIDTVLKAAQASYRHAVRFFIHGDGPLRDLVDQEAAKNPSLTKAKLYSRDHWRETLCRYDVLLLPSISSEGMPMIVLESMALGVVPITTSNPSIGEVVENETRGILVPPNDVGAVVSAISSLSNDRSRLKKMRDNCRAYARANLDIRVNSAKFLGIYQHFAFENQRAT